MANKCLAKNTSCKINPKPKFGRFTVTIAYSCLDCLGGKKAYNGIVDSSGKDDDYNKEKGLIELTPRRHSVRKKEVPSPTKRRKQKQR